MSHQVGSDLVRSVLGAIGDCLSKLHLPAEAHQLIGRTILVVPVEIGVRSQHWSALKMPLVIQVTGIGFNVDGTFIHLYTSLPGLSFWTQKGGRIDHWLLEQLHLQDNSSECLGPNEGGLFLISLVN